MKISVIILSVILAWSSTIPCLAQRLDWGMPIGELLIDSNGDGIDDSYVFQLGAFALNIEPTGVNIDEWLTHWRVFDELTYDTTFGFTTSTAFILNDVKSSSVMPNVSNQSFAGLKAYIWIRKGDHPVLRSEWFVGRAENWTFPQVGGDCCSDEFIAWPTSDLDQNDTPLWGGQNGVIAGGLFEFLSNSGLQTFTFIGVSDEFPTIFQISNGLIPGLDGKQPVTVKGSNFLQDCTVTLRDHRTGETFPNLAKVSQTPTSIELSVNFTSIPAEWSVEVINPGGKTSGQFRFQVQSIAVPLPPQKIFLAFDQPSSFGLVKTIAFATAIPILKPFSSMPAASVGATYRTSVESQLKQIFSRSGVNNIDWVLEDSDDAIVVYFCPLINTDLRGWSRGIDQFNSKRRGEVVVFVDESSPLANLDAETAAHEIGHSLGLQHVNPSSDDDPDDNEVMDYDFSSKPQFLNAVTKRFFPVESVEIPSDHNPFYHLMRYIEGWSPTQLKNAGIEPGYWDTGTSIFTKLSFGGSNLRLYNINLFVLGGDLESTRVIEQIASATLSELSQRSFTIPGGMPITLLASSTEDGVPDVISATGDPFIAANLHVATDANSTQFSLYRQESPTTAVSIASATLESDLTTPYCNLSLTSPNILKLDFRGILQGSSNLSDWTDIGPDTTSPHLLTIPLGQEAGFFRSKQPATP